MTVTTDCFAIQNSENKAYLKIEGDGSESLTGSLVYADKFTDLECAREALNEHGKWIGPLVIVPIQIVHHG